MANNNRSETSNYVYNLPFVERRRFCQMLNERNKWELLAEKMEFDDLTITLLGRMRNPTDELLQKWSHHNHTIEELFVLLSKVSHYRSMELLKPYVEEKYHCLIDCGEGNYKRLHRLAIRDSNKKDLNIDSNNFNKNQPAQIHGDKVIIANGINKDLTVAKIINSPPAPTTDLVPSESDNMLAPSSNPNPATGNDKINKEVKFLADTKLPQISYEELTQATNNWSSYNILGKGGFGTVFKGNWKHTDVAIKRIEQRGPDAIESYLLQLEQSSIELRILNSYRHDNILSLYGYCMGPEAPCLVYQFMINGSLEDRLLLRKQSKPLTWLERHNIAKGTARGLQFLHTIGGKPLIHGDIKSANILLDTNLEPRIGDFGLAREGPEKDSMKVSRIHGTRPYLPQEYLQHKTLSTKIDTYSFGIVLFELATGLSAYDDRRSDHKFLKDYVESIMKTDLYSLKDTKAGTQTEQVYVNLIQIGLWCCNRSSKHRPEMESVLQKFDQS